MTTNLNIITEYNNVLSKDVKRSTIKIKNLIEFLKNKNIKSIGIKDNSMMSVIEYYTKFENTDIHAVIGLSILINNTKIVFYVKNKVGYDNLMYIHSIENLMNEIKPEEIFENIDGLICVLDSENDSVSKETIKMYSDIFKNDFYVELGAKNTLHKVKVKECIKEMDLKYIVGNDTLTLHKDNTDLPNVLKTIKDKVLFDKPDNQIDYSQNYFIDLKEIFNENEYLNAKNDEIVSKCNIDLQLGNPTPPKFKFTKEYSEREGLDINNDEEYFIYRCKVGLEKRLIHISKEKHEIYWKRLQYEMDIINKMKFPGYMLIVWDFIAEAKRLGVPVGPGRGSAAGSLVAFSLEITDLDPIPYGLLFERFLNPDRISMPDVDIDFCQSRRGEIIDYVVKKYGKNQVAQVATFTTLLAKGVLKDVAKTYSIQYSEAEKYTKLIPNELNISLEESKNKKQEIVNKIDNNRLFKRVWDTSIELEGLKRNTGMHAAGVVISDEELWKKSPLFLNDEGGIVTQYSLDYLELIDLIKFDFLGLKTLTVLDNAVKMVKKNHNVDINLSLLDLNDKPTLDLISTGETVGMFQIESSGMKDLNKRLKPDSFEDLIAVLALYRPGPMKSGMLDDFIKRKHGISKISYFFDEFNEVLEPILKPTYGVIVYQEQVMQIVQAVGGFSLGESDLIRRAMGKKKIDVMLAYRKEFAERAEKKGFNYDNSSKLFELIEKFAGYGFNKSHSAAYAMITFQTAWLKKYYPNEFMAALISSVTDNKDKMSLYLSEVKRLGIEMINPDVNISKNQFLALKDGRMLFGLSGIKGVGNIAIEEIEKNQPFSSLSDFIHKVSSKVNRGVIENLALVNGFSSFNEYRKTIIDNLDIIIDYQKEIAASEILLKEGLFSDSYEEFLPKLNLISLGEYEKEDILNKEKDLLGFYLSGHPLDIYKETIQELGSDLLVDIDEDELFEALKNNHIIKKKFSVIGKIDDIQEKMSKKGNDFGIITLVDFQKSKDFLVFSNILDELKEIDLDKPVKINFEADLYNDKLTFKIKEILSWSKIKGGKKIEKPKKIDLINEYKKTTIQHKNVEKNNEKFVKTQTTIKGQDYIVYSNKSFSENEIKELIAL